MRTEMIARKLAHLFTRDGIPKEVITNQGTSFMSKVLQAAWRFLGVQPLCTSIYHLQTNGLVERFNGTFKRMLQNLWVITGRIGRSGYPFCSSLFGRCSKPLQASPLLSCYMEGSLEAPSMFYEKNGKILGRGQNPLPHGSKSCRRNCGKPPK